MELVWPNLQRVAGERKPARFDIGRRPIVAVGRPETIRSILRARPDEFARWREVREVLGEVGANGVFAAEGDTWRRQPRLAVTGWG